MYLCGCVEMGEQFQRDLLRGSLDLMVLSTLANGSQYGYLIQQRIEQATDSRVKIQAGTLYPLLHKLEGAGLIRSRWDETTARKRKWYELTAKGKKQLKTDAAEWQQFVECLMAMLKPAAKQS